MRVMMKYSTIPTSSCEAFTYGQVEDYTVNIASSGRAVASETKDLITDIKVYPNPAREVLYISNTTSEDTESTIWVEN
jgi:hypothetical protein